MTRPLIIIVAVAVYFSIGLGIGAAVELNHMNRCGVRPEFRVDKVVVFAWPVLLIAAGVVEASGVGIPASPCEAA